MRYFYRNGLNICQDVTVIVCDGGQRPDGCIPLILSLLIQLLLSLFFLLAVIAVLALVNVFFLL